MKTVDFSETIAASDLKGSRSRHLIRRYEDLGPRSCTYKNSNWIFSETFCAGLNQTLYESFQVQGN